MFCYIFNQVFSENPVSGERHGGCVNFITGAGGLLQSVLFGYGGLRFRENQMDINPTNLPNATSWAIRRAKYRGVTYDMEVHGSNISVHFINLPPNKTVEVNVNNQKINIQENKKVTFKKQLVTLKVHGNLTSKQTSPTVDRNTTPRVHDNGNVESKSDTNYQNKRLQMMALLLLLIINIC